MRELKPIVCLFLCWTMAIILGSCNAASQSGQVPGTQPLPHSAKGYELYSWQTQGSDWQYTLVTGTNRQKTVQEITAEEDTLGEDGWVKLTGTGVDALLDLLARLPAGEQIFWHGAGASAPEGAEAGHFRLPEEAITAAVEARCRELDLELTVVAGSEESTGPATAPTATGLEARLAVAESLPAGDPVPLTFTLTNHGDHPLYLLKWYTPLEGIAGEIFRVRYNGQTVPYEGILAMRGDPRPKDYVLLAPGTFVTAEVDLAQAYDFSEPGTYSITFLSPRISHIARSEADMAQTVDQLGPVTMPSNTVTVAVETGE